MGTPPDFVINLVKKHFNQYSKLHVLDLGCGKGAVSVQLSSSLKCNCYGIDAIPEFIDASKEIAIENGVDKLCQFEVGDVRVKIEELDKFDVIILGATGPIFDDYYIALTTLRNHLTEEGIIIIEEAYINDASTFQHPSLISRKELLNQFKQAGMVLIDEIVRDYTKFAGCVIGMNFIKKRCNELKTKYPHKSSLFENYMESEASEYDVLEKEAKGSVMVVKNK
jgi:ubiquinone/menaquinone biosynthesis C-methylase UbiE